LAGGSVGLEWVENCRTRTGRVDGVKFSEGGRTPCDNAEASLASE
jgi:hypothetical protein